MSDTEGEVDSTAASDETDADAEADADAETAADADGCVEAEAESDGGAESEADGGAETEADAGPVSAVGQPVDAPGERVSDRLGAAEVVCYWPLRWAFTKGGVTGIAFAVPAMAGVLYVFSRVGIGSPWVEFERMFRLTGFFAAIPAALTFGGLGRLAVRVVHDCGIRRAVVVTGRAGATAGVALIIVAAIPTGMLPVDPIVWAAHACAGAAVGAATSALLVLWIGHPWHRSGPGGPVAEPERDSV